MSIPTLLLFIDYDNLLPTQKQTGLLDVVTRALNKFPFSEDGLRFKCEVRVYGGWYEGSDITPLAQAVTKELLDDFPVVIRIPMKDPGAIRSISTNAELALSLIQEPGHHLFNTYRRKGRPHNVRVQSPASVGCSDAECILPIVRKFIKTGNCPKDECGATCSNLIYRNEQKIVDTMLSCDLIFSGAKSSGAICLISGDDDFLPPLRTVILNKGVAMRFHPKPGCPRASFPPGPQTLLESEL